MKLSKNSPRGEMLKLKVKNGLNNISWEAQRY